MANVRTGIIAQTETANRKTLILDGKRVDGRPQAQGLYDPAHEHDACGIGMIANIKNKPSHEVVQKGLEILENLEHRGAVGADPLMGDGAGILVQTPHAFFAKVLPFALPEKHHYAVAMIFYPNDVALRDKCAVVVRRCLEAEGLELLGERTVPTDNSRLSEGVIATQPIIEQMVIARPEGVSLDEFERKLLIVRKVISNSVYKDVPESDSDNGFYVVSMSARTIVYKGMFLADQLGAFYTDLHDEAFESAIALVHQRFSTNTFPSWKLAHPYRMTTHNGEINTIRGNVNWMAARQASVSSPKFGDDITKIWPISYEGQSDTACFDNALEFLVRGGYSLPHAAMMLIPEAWAGNSLMDEERRAFYEYHAALMEPWDGPAAMSLSDGRFVVATLDRNGLRPARYLVTKEGHVVLASESGVLGNAQHQMALGRGIRDLTGFTGIDREKGPKSGHKRAFKDPDMATAPRERRASSNGNSASKFVDRPVFVDDRLGASECNHVGRIHLRNAVKSSAQVRTAVHRSLSGRDLNVSRDGDRGDVLSEYVPEVHACIDQAHSLGAVIPDGELYF